MGDRSVSAGGNIVGNVIGTGDLSMVSGNVRVTSRAAESVDVVSLLHVVREILVGLETPDSGKIVNALSDAEIEVEKSEPNKDEVGQALERALTYGGKASRFGEIVTSLAPHIQLLAQWLGEGWERLGHALAR